MEQAKLSATILLMSGVLLQGCVGAQAGGESMDDKARRVDARNATARPLPERVPEPRAPVLGEAPKDLVARVREDAIRRSGADSSTVRLIRDEAVTWSDGSLGCPRPGEVYPQMPVRGFWIVFNAPNRDYDYRTDEVGNFNLCEGARTTPPATSRTQN